MNGAQIHLALNHIPVVLSLVSLAVLLWGWFSRNAEIKKVGLTLALATAIFAGAAYWTGEPAEHVLKKFPNFPRPAVHAHEDAGEVAFIISLAAGLSALAGFYLAPKKNKFSWYAYLLTVALIFISTLAFLNTAHLGGLIRHDEIRSDNLP
jgi:uncharacterized membrane protein